MSRALSSHITTLVRPATDKALDASALSAIAQAAVNVELFTVPLYMGTLYSVQGVHQITGKNAYYKHRLWPGPATTAPRPGVALTDNQKAFNVIFSVFIEEMLHLQLASQLANAVGRSPVFDSNVLQDGRHGWTCYGPDKTVIPHIVDLRDTITYEHVKVNIAALSREQLDLFLAIESPEAIARQNLKPPAERVTKNAYFPTVPFEGWTTHNSERDLPMFGTIGAMYQCYLDYMSLHYDDDTTLWDYVYLGNQRDLFNVHSKGHPHREYPGFDTTLGVAGYQRAMDMMDAITDQGEGSTLIPPPRGAPDALQVVDPRYQASREALEADYPKYDDVGNPVPSSDAAARADSGGLDHYERFQELAEHVVAGVVTWPAWFAEHGPWTAADLQTSGYDPNDNPYDLPSTEAIAAALNTMASPAERDANYALLSTVAAGSIAGVTTVLNNYWELPGVSFPYPSMAGSGDRMAICWAVFGQPPDLSVGVSPADPAKLYHSCQGLDFQAPGADCAANEVFHACRGSNGCKAQGGCGFVQETRGGGICGFALVAAKDVGTGATDTDTLYSPPSDNKCGTFGGCAVPISASQILPTHGTMQLFDFGEPPDFVFQAIEGPEGKMAFREGEKVHDVAYRAYLTVMRQHPDTSGIPQPPPDPQPPNVLRLVFPPST